LRTCTARPGACPFTPAIAGTIWAVCVICPALHALSAPMVRTALAALAAPANSRRFERVTVLLLDTDAHTG
jgi:hypothetical protein